MRLDKSDINPAESLQGLAPACRKGCETDNVRFLTDKVSELAATRPNNPSIA